jgi:hypothetical protein
MVRVSANTEPLFVGQPGQLSIILECSEPTNVAFVRVHVECRHGWAIGNGNTRIAHEAIDLYARELLMEGGELPAGTTTLPFELTIPFGAPPTHAIEPAHARTHLHVHVSRPWRLDDHVDIPLSVRQGVGPRAVRDGAVQAPRTSPQPSTWSSRVAHAGAPRIELGLATSEIAAGEKLVGSVAVFHMDDSDWRPVTIAFVPLFALQGRGRARMYVGAPVGVTVQIPPFNGGTSIPFEVRAPPELTPSFSSGTQVLAWHVTALTGSLFGGRVEVQAPITILDRSAATEGTELLMAPGLTDDRVAGAFANVAKFHEWRALTSVTTIAKTVLDGEAELQLEYVHRADGTFLIARVAYASLGLGLEVTPVSPLRHMFHKDIELDIKAWDRTHLVHARSAEQAIPVLRAAVPALEEAAALGPVVRWTDHAITFERAVVAVEPVELVAATELLTRVARAILDAAARVTPLPGCDVDLVAWKALATELGGHLALGDLSINAARPERVPVQVSLELDDESPTAVHVALGKPALDATSEPERVAELVQAFARDWPADLTDLHVACGVASGSWKLPAGGPIDVSRVRDLIDKLHALLAALSPGGGPYR